MHIISRKALKTFWEQNADSKAPLLRWFQIVERSTFCQLRGFAPDVSECRSSESIRGIQHRRQ